MDSEHTFNAISVHQSKRCESLVVRLYRSLLASVISAQVVLLGCIGVFALLIAFIDVDLSRKSTSTETTDKSLPDLTSTLINLDSVSVPLISAEPKINANPFEKNVGFFDNIFDNITEERSPDLSAPLSSNKLDSPQPTNKIRVADILLQEAKLLFAKDSTQSLLLTLQAAEIFRHFGQPVPNEAFAILAQGLNELGILRTETQLQIRPTKIAVCPNGRCLLLVENNNTLWLLNGDEPIKVGKTNRNLTNLIVSPDSQSAVVATEDGMISLWNLDNAILGGGSAIIFEERIPNLKTLAISPNGKWLAAFGASSKSHENAVYNKDVSKSPLASTENPQRRVLTEQAEQPSIPTSVYLWDLTHINRRVPKADVLRGHEKEITALAFSCDSQFLATGSEDNTARVFDLRSGSPAIQQLILKGHERAVTTLVFGADSKWLATGSKDKSIRVWGIQSPSTAPLLLLGHSSNVVSLTSSKDGKWLASAGDDRIVRLWATDFRTPPLVLGTTPNSVVELKFLNNDEHLLVRENRDVFQLWKLSSDLQHEAIALSADMFDNTENAIIIVRKDKLGYWPLENGEIIAVAAKYRDENLPLEKQEQAERFVRDIEKLIY